MLIRLTFVVKPPYVFMQLKTHKITNHEPTGAKAPSVSRRSIALGDSLPMHTLQVVFGGGVIVNTD